MGHKSQAPNARIFEIDDKKYVVDPNTGELFELLSDKKDNGKERPWREHKQQNEQVQHVYDSIADSLGECIDPDSGGYYRKKANRLANCGQTLFFNVYANPETGGEKMKIKSADSCRVRLCPLCSWRRSIKIATHTKKILEAMQKEDEDKYDYLLLTLTVPNVSADELNKTIDDMMNGWRLLMQYAKVRSAVLGWYRALEITHNVKPTSKSFDTYHPHFHCIIAVDKNAYYKSGNYISHADWLTMWQLAMKNPAITQVDVRKVRPKQGHADIFGAVCETCKYTVKTGDYIVPNDWQMTMDVVRTLDKCLANRRLVAYGGVMKQYHSLLNLDDEIDGNLINDSDETINGDVIATRCYVWNTGYQQYLMK